LISYDTHITKVIPEELKSLQKICKQTFLETYGSANTAQDMVEYLQRHFNSDQLKSEFENPESEFYFAKSGDEVIGYLKVNFGEAHTELGHKGTAEIERIYVANNFQGKKVGQELCTKAVEVAKDKSANYLWLGVWEMNTKAIQFYKKSGFVEFGKHNFTLGSDEQTDLMMKLDTSANK